MGMGMGKRTGMIEWEWKGMGILLYVKIPRYLVMLNNFAMFCHLVVHCQHNKLASIKS